MTYPGQRPSRRPRRVITTVLTAAVIAGGITAAVLWPRDPDKHPGAPVGERPGSVAQIMTDCGAVSTKPVPDTNPALVLACLFGKVLTARATPSMAALVQPLQTATQLNSSAIAPVAPITTAGETITLLGFLVDQRLPYNQDPATVPHLAAFNIRLVWKAEPRAAVRVPRWCQVGAFVRAQDFSGQARVWALDVKSARCQDSVLDTTDWGVVPR